MNTSLTNASRGKSSKKLYAPTQIRKLLQNSTQSARFFNIGQIQPYQNINRPKLTPEKRTTIKERLELDQSAQLMAKFREKQGELFLKYDINPFMNLSQNNLHKTQTQNLKKSTLNQRKSHKTSTHSHLYKTKIFEALWTDRKMKKIQNHENNQAKLVQYSNKLSTNVSKLRYPPTETPQLASTPYLRSEKNLTFEEIIQMEDENYFIQNQTDINIFKIMKGNRENILTNEMLTKYYFCKDSMMEKKEKFSIPTYRDLSTLSRLFATRRFKGTIDARLQALKSSELSVNCNMLKIEDLLSVASGRITSDFAFNIINEVGLRKTSTSFEKKTEEISWDNMQNENRNQKMMNFTLNDQEISEVSHYLNLENTNNESKFENRCEYFYTNLVKELKNRQNLCRNTIYDACEHQKSQNKIESEYEGLFYIDERMSSIDRDRMIRFNKTNKTRNDKIKVKQLLKTLVMKNRSEREVHSLLKQRKIR